MRRLKFTTLAFAALVLAGCGGSTGNSGPNNINGNWFASLDTNSTTLYAFSVTLTQGAGTTVAITDFSFPQPGPCFLSDFTSAYPVAGTFTQTGISNGVLNGNFSMSITTPEPGGPTLTLQGTVNGVTMTGTWTGTGTNCSGSGSFLMSQPLP